MQVRLLKLTDDAGCLDRFGDWWQAGDWRGGGEEGRSQGGRRPTVTEPYLAQLQHWGQCRLGKPFICTLEKTNTNPLRPNQGL